MFDIFTIWGKCKTAEDFIDKFLIWDLYSSPNGKELAEKAGILKEFKKLLSTSARTQRIYRSDEERRQDDPKAFETAEDEFKKYIKHMHTGDAELEYEKISHFIELISDVSQRNHARKHTHPSLVPQVMRWQSDYIDEWDYLGYDLNFLIRQWFL